jgi:hypothetical protein
MLKKKSNKLIAILLSVLLSGLIPAAVTFADNLVVYGDALVAETPVSINGNVLNLGTIEQGKEVTSEVTLAISRNGNYSNGAVFIAGTSVEVTLVPVSGNNFKASLAEKDINIPQDWAASSNNTTSGDKVNSSITVSTLTANPGNYDFTLTYQAKGKQLDKDNPPKDLTVSYTLTVKYEVVAPEAPTDTTAPEITIITPKDGATYFLDEVVYADWDVKDSDSEVTSKGTVAKGEAIDTLTVGSKTFTVTAEDTAGNKAEEKATYNVIYDFKGFFQPVDMNGTLNVAKAGSSIPIKFSLDGDQGLAIFKGLPDVRDYVGPVVAVAEDEIELIYSVSAGNSSLSYDATTGLYTYVWKTDKGWAGNEKTLVVKFVDGTQYTAHFRFK